MQTITGKVKKKKARSCSVCFEDERHSQESTLTTMLCQYVEGYSLVLEVKKLANLQDISPSSSRLAYLYSMRY